MRLLLVRHGESEANAAGILQGQLDAFGLTARGRLQSVQVAQQLTREARADLLLSSPLRRARETAEILGATLGLSPTYAPELQEYDFGVASGMTSAEIARRWPEFAHVVRQGPPGAYAKLLFDTRPTIPGEEGMPRFLRRLHDLLERLQAQGGGTVLVTHGGAITALTALALRLDCRDQKLGPVPNGSVTELALDSAGGTILLRYGHTGSEGQAQLG